MAVVAMPQRPFGRTDFERVFAEDSVFVSPSDGPFVVETVYAGTLAVPSGQIIVCDPSYLPSTSDVVAFTQIIPPGHYPVWLALARPAADPPSYARVACALMRISKAQLASWEMALRPGEDPTTLPLGYFFGHGVDSGTSCFVDAVTVADFATGEAAALLRERLIHAYDLNGWSLRWADVTVRDESELNLLTFSSGYGDGSYPSWWGYDVAGKVCALAVDFHLLIEELWGEARFPIHAWNGRKLEQPDLPRIGVSARLLPLEQDALEVRVMFAKYSCETELINEPGATRSARVIQTDGTEEHIFTLTEPLYPDATLVLRYLLGLRGL